MSQKAWISESSHSHIGLKVKEKCLDRSLVTYTMFQVTFSPVLVSSSPCIFKRKEERKENAIRDEQEITRNLLGRMKPLKFWITVIMEWLLHVSFRFAFWTCCNWEIALANSGFLFPCHNAIRRILNYVGNKKVELLIFKVKKTPRLAWMYVMLIKHMHSL